MWVLDLNTDQGGGSYGMYLMKCDYGHHSDVEQLVGEIIEGFEAAGNDEWDVSDISYELNTKGFENEYIECLSINV